jgi:glucan phosphoethanolaminetransferase (alkaline phosphatase superfamily)
MLLITLFNKKELQTLSGWSHATTHEVIFALIFLSITLLAILPKKVLSKMGSPFVIATNKIVSPFAQAINWIKNLPLVEALVQTTKNIGDLIEIILEGLINLILFIIAVAIIGWLGYLAISSISDTIGYTPIAIIIGALIIASAIKRRNKL